MELLCEDGYSECVPKSVNLLYQLFMIILNRYEPSFGLISLLPGVWVVSL